uniref:Putative zn finger n=1 Tax=Lutzomyia longipalpis TaxID=7200 RepID=A0A1B0GHV4_LUTLO
MTGRNILSLIIYICWQNHTDLNALKAQLVIIVQEWSPHQEQLHPTLQLSQTDDQVDPLSVVVVKEEQKVENDESKSDDDWNPWDGNITEPREESSRMKREKIPCLKCSKMYCQGKRLDDHIAQCSGNEATSEEKPSVQDEVKKKSFSCAFCGNEFLRKHQIIAHMRSHVKLLHRKVPKPAKEDSSFEKTSERTCKICNKTCYTSRGLMRHVKFHEKKKANGDKQEQSARAQFPCDGCKRNFRNEGALRRHVEFRESANITCDMCTEHFCTPTDFQTHQRMVHKINTAFKCRYCDEQFSNFRTIAKHHHATHPTEMAPESPFMCEMCGTVMMDLRDLSHHVKIMHESKRFKCEVCRKTFRFQKELDEHGRIHIPLSQLQDLYECDVCPKKFRIKTSLERHKRLHTGATPELFCPVCQRRFISAKVLEQHIPKHANEAPRPYKCDACDKAFKTLKEMNRHRKDKHNIFTHAMLNPKNRKKN